MASPEMNDATVLRAIAHPVRTRILTELSAHGSMRAADVAASLGIPANQASFHLRQLAKYGLVEEDPTAARDRRDRVWKEADPDRSFSLGEVEKQPGGRAASAVFRRQKAAWGRHVVDEAYTDDRTPGRFIGVMEQPIRLTKAEAEELAHEVVAVGKRWMERGRGGHDDDRRTYLLFQIVMPFPDDPASPATGPD